MAGALFDVLTVGFATGGDARPGIALAVAEGMADSGSRAGFVDCSADTPRNHGAGLIQRLSLAGPAQALGETVALQRSLLAAACNVLCIEDRLWDTDGGAAAAAVLMRSARRAGRRVVVLCGDAGLVHRRRAQMRLAADTHADYLAGEAQAVLALHDYQRLDSLVPRLRMLGRGGVIRRESRPPLVFDGEVLTWQKNTPPPSAAEFWRKALPFYLTEIAASGSLRSFAEFSPWKSGLPMPTAAQAAAE